MKKKFFSEYKDSESVGKLVGQTRQKDNGCPVIEYIDLLQQEQKENKYNKYANLPWELRDIELSSLDDYQGSNRPCSYSINLSKIDSISNKGNIVYYSVGLANKMNKNALILTSEAMVKLKLFIIQADMFIENTIGTQTESIEKLLSSNQLIEYQKVTEESKEIDILGDNLKIESEL